MVSNTGIVILWYHSILILTIPRLKAKKKKRWWSGPRNDSRQQMVEIFEYLVDIYKVLGNQLIKPAASFLVDANQNPTSALNNFFFQALVIIIMSNSSLMAHVYFHAFFISNCSRILLSINYKIYRCKQISVEFCVNLLTLQLQI